jgi:hypothetical protein
MKDEILFPAWHDEEAVVLIFAIELYLCGQATLGLVT